VPSGLGFAFALGAARKDPRAATVRRTRQFATATSFADDAGMPPASRPVIAPRALSLVTICALSWASLASAAPAVVKQDTEARTAPFNVAPLVETLAPGAKLEADEQANGGWRRVRLPDGKFAFVRDADIAVDLSHAAPPPAPAKRQAAAAPLPAPAEPATSATAPVEPLSTPVPGGTSLQYVGTFAHLADLVKSDPKVFDLADGIATRRTAASALVWGGAFGGILLAALGSFAAAHDAFSSSTNATLISAGGAIFFLGPLVGAAIWPLHDDQTAVINLWNARHPDRPFIDHAGVEVPR
jgi:hypothetical protein